MGFFSLNRHRIDLANYLPILISHNNPMTAFIYEPFYDFDRYFNSFLHGATPTLLIHHLQQNPRTSDGAFRALKPR